MSATTSKSEWFSVSRSLQILAAIALITIVSVTVQQLLQTRGAMLDTALQQMQRLDMVFAKETSRSIETVDVVLQNMADHMAWSPASDADQVDADLVRRISGMRQIESVSLLNQSGGVRFSSIPIAVQPLPAVAVPAAAAALAAHRADPHLGLQISEPMLAADHRWIAMLTRRVQSDDGADGFCGIALAVIYLSDFEDFYRAAELKDDGVIALYHRNGTMLARYPASDPMIGTNAVGEAPFTDILAHNIAGFMMTDEADGGHRMLAIRALRNFPLAVMVSIDKGMVLSSWWRQVWIFGLSAWCAALAIASVLLMLAHRTAQVEELFGEANTAKDQAQSANLMLMEQMAERERAETALSHAQRVEAMGQLTGGVAHDFNNLLTIILGNITLLELENQLQPTDIDRLDTMRAAAERGAKITSQMLAFARRQPLLPRQVDINTVLVEMRDLLNTVLGPLMVQHQVLDQTLCTALVDPTQFEMVVLNLVINARDAMPRGGVLTIATENVAITDQPPPGFGAMSLSPGDYIAVRVSDSGTGMPPEVAARAFDPFYTTKAAGSGTGLGLSQVQGVARQSGGGVSIETVPGAGTTVTVFLPRTSALAAADQLSTHRTERNMRTRQAVILVVDDVGAVLALTSRMLELFGYTVRSVGSAAAALESLHDDPAVDLILTDIVMPGMGGADLAREVRTFWPRLPILFMSGYADPDTTADLMQDYRLVQKPFRPAELAAEIEGLLAETSSRRLETV